MKTVLKPQLTAAVIAQAEWRGTTPVCPQTGRLCIAFDGDDGKVTRLAISRDSARRLADTVLGYLAADQSARSSGIPSEAGLMPLAGQKVTPLATSSAATCGDV